MRVKVNEKVKIVAKPCFYFGRTGIVTQVFPRKDYLLRNGVLIGNKLQYFADCELVRSNEKH